MAEQTALQLAKEAKKADRLKREVAAAEQSEKRSKNRGEGKLRLLAKTEAKMARLNQEVIAHEVPAKKIVRRKISLGPKEKASKGSAAQKNKKKK